MITLFKRNNLWGAIGKTNHAVLRYREPVYKTPRELAMSFFHEYFLNSNGKKTLRKFSNPINLNKFNKHNWITSEEDVWFIPDHLAKVKHNPAKKNAHEMEEPEKPSQAFSRTANNIFPSIELNEQLRRVLREPSLQGIGTMGYLSTVPNSFISTASLKLFGTCVS